MNVGERTYEVLAGALAGAAEHLPWARRGGWGAKWRRGVEARRGAPDRIAAWARSRRDPGRPLVWMHAASVGEGLQAKAILERLRARRPDVQVFFTYFSPSAEDWAVGFPADGAECLPFDRVRDCELALSTLGPNALVFCKLDVWPVLTRVARDRRVPLGLVSGTLAPNSSRLRPVARWVLRAAYARLDRVGAIAEGDAERLIRLGVRPGRILVTGDARFDQVWARARAIDRKGPLLAPLLDSGRVTLVAGSTWPEDEARLFPAFQDARRACPRLRLIVVPHEPEAARMEALESRLRALGLRATRHSALRGEPWDALVVDRVGILGELYAVGEVAYVGGAFGQRGIHSVLEPAALGVPVLYGPRHRNAREASELAAVGAGFPAANEEELRAGLRTLAVEAERRRGAGGAARRYVESNLGGADRNADLVVNLLSRA